MYKFNIIDKLSIFLIVLAALISGITGILGFNLIEIIFGEPLNFIGRLLYILVGVAGIDILLFLFKAKTKYTLHK
ncbi:uncharacterized membrane protein YuzA (DUF378 family) [Clostridium algifaecis]|uniref:Uncharacterized membrane protein YuzA (DUF378 family) n=1 Tax=Clostridium algifaecis TaxID=1472040 RepID=A0ABS4KQE6_9CLOT|nr:DUF378 domain-containing protein [Clostridium algifaecis]MBP2031691.1 uncharacterized membrane protein YuzA (DUF378 family) [Clostridium algifaecis]